MTKKNKIVPINTRFVPSNTHMRRAMIADALFQAHAKINSAMGAAAFEIIDGADINGILHMVRVAVNAALDEAQRQIEPIV